MMWLAAPKLKAIRACRAEAESEGGLLDGALISKYLSQK